MLPAPAPHVLVYDGDPTLLRLYGDLLGEEGYRVSLGRDVPQDASAVLALAPDLIIVDLVMGREEVGGAFVGRLRTLAGTSRVPVIVCSGDAVRLERQAVALAAWGCAVVRKPFDIDVFLAAVETCLGEAAAAA